ncbi:MAG: hypothetical protein L7V86_04230 [Verrucomicrobiales bacterium]|nr:hypothetical protein [Verrucomicrobiales bacterium]
MAVGVVSDGSALLGPGNIGPSAAIPVMEGKAMLFKEFGNVRNVGGLTNDFDALKDNDSVARYLLPALPMVPPSFGVQDTSNHHSRHLGCS